MAEQRQQHQDCQWLAKLRSGDERCFTEFVDRYKQTVFLCCYTLGLSEDEAEDVASETFLAAFQGIGRYSAKSKLSTWLWRIAYHKAVSFLRKKIRRAELRKGCEDYAAESRSSRPDEVLERVERSEIVLRAIRQLPVIWAMAMVLFYSEGESVKSIAKIMRTRENTVKTYLFRGRERMREILSRALGEQANEE